MASWKAMDAVSARALAGGIVQVDVVLAGPAAVGCRRRVVGGGGVGGQVVGDGGELARRLGHDPEPRRPWPRWRRRGTGGRGPGSPRRRGSAGRGRRAGDRKISARSSVPNSSPPDLAVLGGEHLGDLVAARPVQLLGGQVQAGVDPDQGAVQVGAVGIQLQSGPDLVGAGHGSQLVGQHGPVASEGRAQARSATAWRRSARHAASPSQSAGGPAMVANGSLSSGEARYPSIWLSDRVDVDPRRTCGPGPARPGTELDGLVEHGGQRARSRVIGGGAVLGAGTESWPAMVSRSACTPCIWSDMSSTRPASMRCRSTRRAHRSGARRWCGRSSSRRS
jgi:hypothetical protein